MELQLNHKPVSVEPSPTRVVGRDLPNARQLAAPAGLHCTTWPAKQCTDFVFPCAANKRSCVLFMTATCNKIEFYECLVLSVFMNCIPSYNSKKKNQTKKLLGCPKQLMTSKMKLNMTTVMKLVSKAVGNQARHRGTESW